MQHATCHAVSVSFVVYEGMCDACRVVAGVVVDAKTAEEKKHVGGGGGVCDTPREAGGKNKAVSAYECICVCAT